MQIHPGWELNIIIAKVYSSPEFFKNFHSLVDEENICNFMYIIAQNR